MSGTPYYGSCPNPPLPTCSDCVTKELGRVRGLALVSVGYTFSNPANPNEWATLICNSAQGINPNAQAWVFPYFNGTATQTELLSDGYGNVPQVLDSYEYKIEGHEPQYVNNVPFWNAIKKSNAWIVVYKTQNYLHFAQASGLVFAKAPVQADPKTKIDLMITGQWVQSDLIVPVAAPPQIFTQCVDC